MFPADFIVPHPIWIAVAIIVAIIVVKSIRIANQYERAVVFAWENTIERLDRACISCGSFIEWQTKLDLRTRSRLIVEQQESITSDNVPIKIEAVIW